MLPRVFGKTEMYSTRLINVHFWIATLGTVLYIAALWISGVMQGLMWRATNPDGTLTISSTMAGTLWSAPQLKDTGIVWSNAGSISGSVTITPDPAVPVKFYRVTVP